MSSYLYLVMAVVSLGMLGVVHKVADHRRCHPAAINFVIFLAAALMTLAVCMWRFGSGSIVRIPGAAWITAGGCGFLASFATLRFQQGIRHGRISTSWLVINLSTALPTALSIIIYHEALGVRRVLGLALAGVALLMLWLERAQEENANRAAAAAQIANEA